MTLRFVASSPPIRVDMTAYLYSALPAVSFRLVFGFKQLVAPTPAAQTVQLPLLSAVPGELINALVLASSSILSLNAGGFSQRQTFPNGLGAEASAPIVRTLLTCNATVQQEWAMNLLSLIPADEFPSLFRRQIL